MSSLASFSFVGLASKSSRASPAVSLSLLRGEVRVGADEGEQERSGVGRGELLRLRPVDPWACLHQLTAGLQGRLHPASGSRNARFRPRVSILMAPFEAVLEHVWGSPATREGAKVGGLRPPTFPGTCS